MAHRFGDNGDGGGHRGRGRERKCGGADATRALTAGLAKLKKRTVLRGVTKRKNKAIARGIAHADRKEVKAKKKVARRGLRLEGKQLY